MDEGVVGEQEEEEDDDDEQRESLAALAVAMGLLSSSCSTMSSWFPRMVLGMSSGAGQAWPPGCRERKEGWDGRDSDGRFCCCGCGLCCMPL